MGAKLRFRRHARFGVSVAVEEVCGLPLLRENIRIGGRRDAAGRNGQERALESDPKTRCSLYEYIC